MEITIDNARINMMRGNPGIMAGFPLLGLNLPSQGSCCHKKASAVPDYEGIRRAIASLPTERKNALKQLLGVAKITLHVPTGHGVETVQF